MYEKMIASSSLPTIHRGLLILSANIFLNLAYIRQVTFKQTTSYHWKYFSCIIIP